MADTSDGDARIALSNLQLVLQHNMNNICLLTIDDIKEEIKVYENTIWFVLIFIFFSLFTEISFIVRQKGRRTL